MLAATAAAVLATASPALAAPKTNLTLSYQSDAGYAAAAKLRCGPLGGGHPQGKQACAALKRVGGRPGLLRAPPDVMCTMEYAPVTARMTGTWKGTKVSWSQRFGNQCDLTRTTGALYAF